MGYHTNLYLLVFLPAVLLLYQLTPRKFRPYTLLAASYAYFFVMSRMLFLVLAGLTAATHWFGLWIFSTDAAGREALAGADKTQKKELKKQFQDKKRHVLQLGILLILAVLFYAQYLTWTVGNLNSLFSVLGTSITIPAIKTFFPIGISFYSMEAIGYLADVYWDRIPVERNLARLALFLAFFPQLMEGPIARYTDTADQLWKGNPLRLTNISEGFCRILWGLFKKMIVADRLAKVVDMIFDNYRSFHGYLIIFSAIAYTVQLYMEFSGSIDIVIGSARMFDVRLPENFNQPFAAESSGEFWRRWHMSLGTWFKNYLFYPVTVSKPVKNWSKTARKKYGKYASMVGTSAMALLPVWLATGIWHGPRWTYLFYGFYYFVILLAEVAISPPWQEFAKAHGINTDARWYHLLLRFKTWIVIFIGELFFRAETMTKALHMFGSIFRGFHPDHTLAEIFLNPDNISLQAADYMAVVAGVIVVALVGHYREKGVPVMEKIQTARTPVRWAVYYALIMAILYFGAYGAGFMPVDLIYAGF